MKLSDILMRKAFEDTKSGLTSTLRRSIFFPFLLMGMICLLSIYQTQRLLSLSKWTQHTEQAIALIQTAQKDAITLESGLRGFLLTGDTPFLEPFEDSRASLPAQLARLERFVSDNPAQIAHVQELRKGLRKWTDHALSLINRKKRGQIADTLLRTQLPKEKMDDIRSIFARMLETEEILRQQRRADVENGVRNSTAATLALAIFWGIVLAAGMRRQLLKVSSSYDTLVEELEEAQVELKKSHDELEARVQERTAALTTSNAELESFCYSVSHDLRAPLRGIDGFSQALLEDYGPSLDPTAQRYLSFVRDGVQKMGKLIDDLLDLSRLSRVEMKKQSVDLGALAKGIIQELSEQEPHRKFAFENLPREFAKIHGDPGLLGAMLQNLLSNAWKFTSKNDVSKIEFGIGFDRGKSAFYIRDNGAGFDMTFESKLFGAFQRLHSPKEFKGTGVGLATVRRIVHRHGGEVWAQSQVGKGATFYFTLGEPNS